MKKGDVVAIYMPMVPELVIAMLACARIGAPHTVVFGGFSAESLAGRIQDCRRQGARHRRRRIPPRQDRAAQGTRRRRRGPLPDSITDVVVLRADRPRHPHGSRPRPLVARPHDRRFQRLPGRAARQRAPALHPLHLRLDRQAQGHPAHHRRLPAGRDADDRMGFRPQGRRHLLVHRRRRLDHRPLVSHLRPAGPRARPCVMYEGAPNWPDEARFWKIIEDYRVSILYTAPTAIRAFMKWGEHFPRRHDLSSLRLLGTVGEPINPEAWMWYHEGHRRRPVPDRRHLVADRDRVDHDFPAPRRHAHPAGFGHPSLAWYRPRGRHQGRRAGRGRTRGASSSSSKPWPSMLRTLWGDDDRYQTPILERRPRRLLHRRRRPPRRPTAIYWVMGRVDDVLNVSGHRLRRWRSNPPWSATPPSPRPPWWASRTTSRVRPSPRSSPSKAVKPPPTTSRRPFATTSSRRSEPSPAPTTSGSPTPCPKPGAARSCAGCSATSPQAVESTGDTSTLEDLSVLAKLRESDEA